MILKFMFQILLFTETEIQTKTAKSNKKIVDPGSLKNDLWEIGCYKQ